MTNDWSNVLILPEVPPKNFICPIPSPTEFYSPHPLPDIQIEGHWETKGPCPDTMDLGPGTCLLITEDIHEIIGWWVESSLFLFSPICFSDCILAFRDRQCREQAASNYRDKNTSSNSGDQKAWRKPNPKLKQMEPLSKKRIWPSCFFS